MADFPEGFFYIRSRHSSKVIDVGGASTKDDAKVLLWPPKHDRDRDNQLWYYDGGFLINKHSGKVLDVRGGTLEKNARIIQYHCKSVEEAQNQRWGYHEGYIYVLSDRHWVLDTKDGLAADGTRLILYPKEFDTNSHKSQLWDLVPAHEVRAEREVLFETDFD